MLIHAAGNNIDEDKGVYFVLQYGEPFNTRAPQYIINKMVDPGIIANIRSLGHRAKFVEFEDGEVKNLDVVRMEEEDEEENVGGETAAAYGLGC